MRTIALDGKVLVFSWPTGDRAFGEILDFIKEVPGRRWNLTKKRWEAPVSIASVASAAVLLSEYGFNGDPALRARIEGLSQQHDRLSVASRAATADVAGLEDLYPFQRAGVAYALDALAPHKGVLIGDEQGLGKTVQSIKTVDKLGAYPCLFVTRSGLKINTEREIAMWTKESSAVRIGGLTPDMSVGQLRMHDFVIVNHDVLAGRARGKGWLETLQDVKFDSVIVDECQDFKDPKSKRTLALTQLVTGVEKGKRKPTSRPIPYRLALSGTPFMNGLPSELMAILKILGRMDDLGGFNHYATRYCNATRTKFGMDMGGATNLDELNSRLRSACYVRREKTDVLTELPDKTYLPLYMELSNRAEYDKVEASYLEVLKELEEEPWRALDDPAKRGAHVQRITELRKLAAFGKLPALFEWTDAFLQSQQKLVAFCWHRDVVFAFAERYAGDLAGEPIIGGVPDKEKDHAVRTFQEDPRKPLILGNTQAMGVGLTLTAASTVLHVELPWRPGDLDQATDRCHRIGQKNAVFAYCAIASGTIDDEMLGTLTRKKARATQATTGTEEVEESAFVRVLKALWKKAKT